MKLVKGLTLSKLLADREEPTAERGKFIGIFEQICQTMAYAHSRGVIHRDLKPANIMVGAFGEVQVMDWGLAKVLQVGGVADEKKSQTLQQGQSIIQTMRSGVGSDSPGTFGSLGSETQMGSVMGTPAYMPPEQALGEIDQMDERADVFGLGAILCEILTGQPPYVADDGTRVFRMASRGKLEDAFSRLDASGADADLIVLTKHCLELEPGDRPRDAGVLAERVTGYLESVEAKLREAEVQRAAEAARADAEAAQANAERQRAEAQTARAEAESARANEESKRRRTSLALAASVLLLVGLGSGGWLYIERQAANRGRQQVRQQAELVVERTERAEAMELLAEQRDDQRKAAEESRATAVTARQDAERERKIAVGAKSIAETAEEEGRRLLYATDMQLVDALLKDEESSARQILSRLNAHDPDRPANANTDNANPDGDLRGFEWHYFKSVLDKRSTNFDGFDQPVVGSALTAEGELVTLDNAGQLRRFDAATRIETRPTLDLKQGRQLGPKALSADGRMVALAIGDKIHLVDTTTGAELVPAIETLGTYGVIFSPDATMLVTVDAKIAWWDTATGKQLAIADSLLEIKAARPVSISADGLTVAVGGQGGSSQAWSAFRMEPDTGNVTVLQDKFNKDGVGTMRTLAVTPDGKSVAIAMSLSSHLSFHDILSGKLVGGSPSEHASSIATIGFNPKSHEMITGSIDGVLKFWKDYRQLLSAETRDAPETRSLQGHDQSITQAVIAADGKRIISSSLDQTTRIWDVQTQTASLAQPVTALTSYRSVYSPDGLLIIGGGDGEIRVCEAATGRLVRSIELDAIPFESTKIEQAVVAVSPDNRLVAVGRGKFAELWDLESGQRLHTLPVIGSAAGLAFSPDGKYLVGGRGDFNFHLGKKYEGNRSHMAVYEVATGRLIRDVLDHRNAVMSVVFSPDGELLASASHDRTARIWNTETWQTIHVLDNPDESDGTTATGSGVEDVAFSPDGTRLAMASHAGNVHIFDTQSAELIETLRGHAGMVNCVRFSPDGRTLVSGGTDGTTRLWNAATWRQLTTLNSGSSYFRPQSLRFSPDGRQLLAAGPETVFWSSQPWALNQPGQLANNLKPLLKSKSSFRNRIRLLSENRQLREALELLDSQEPLVQTALAATRANWHASQERWTDAVDEFERLTELNPESQPSWLRVPGMMRLSRAYLEQDQPARAAELLVTASEQVEEDGISRTRLTGIRYDTKVPIRLCEVTPGSPASRAGLQAGDVIAKVNEVDVTDVAQFSSLLAGGPGTRIQLTVQHEGSEQTEQVELIEELSWSDPMLARQVDALRSRADERLSANAEDAALLQFRAELYGLLLNRDAQISDLTAAIAARSGNPDQTAAPTLARLYHRRGDSCFASEQWQMVIDDYTRVLAAEPEHTNIAELLARRGKAHSAVGQTDQAIADLKRSLELQPTAETAERLADRLLPATTRWTIRDLHS
jgi:WD40 repeat protein